MGSTSLGVVAGGAHGAGDAGVLLPVGIAVSGSSSLRDATTGVNPVLVLSSPSTIVKDAGTATLAFAVSGANVPVPALVQQHSTVGDGVGTTQVETFAAAVAGNAMILAVTTNENAGPSNISTPAGWTLLGQFRIGTTHVNVAVFGMIAVGGETSVTVTVSAASQRVQTWFGEFSGYSLTLDGAMSSAGATSGLAADTGTDTPAAGGRLWLGVVSVKNAPASGLTGSGAGVAAVVNNEGGALTGQKVTMGVWYDLNRASAARQQPTWTTTSAPWAGLGILLTPTGAPPAFDATITVDRGTVLVASTSTELHALHVQNSIRGRATNGGPTGFAHNPAALTRAITLCNTIFDGHGNHINDGNGWQMLDSTPNGGLTVGAQVAGATLNIDNGANFPTASGTLIAKVYNTRAGTVFTFTGKSTNTLTGCSGLPATIPAGSPVVLYQLTSAGSGGRPLLSDTSQAYSVKELFDLMTGTKRTLVLHGASVWTHGQATQNFPPRAEYIQAWAYACAELAAQFAANGTPISHVDVWNEYKGWASQATPTAGQGGTGSLQNGVSPVWQPGDAGAFAALQANYNVTGFFLLHYQLMFNAVWDAFKNHPNAAVNTIHVMGPHVGIGPYTNGSSNERRFPYGSYNGTLQASGFFNGTNVPDGYDRNRLCYFLDYATDFDGLALDYSVAGFNASPYDEAHIHANLDSFRHIIKQARSVLANRSGLSVHKRAAQIHFIEYYADVDLGRVGWLEMPTNTGLSDIQQGYFEGAILRRFLEEGLNNAYKWQPMGDGGDTTSVPLYDKQAFFLHTQIADSGAIRQPEATNGDPAPATLPGGSLPAGRIAALIKLHFPVGTTMYVTSCDDASGKIWAISSLTKTIIGNGYPTSKIVVAEGSARTVPAYSLLAVDA